MNGFVYRLAYATGFVYCNIDFAIHKRVCVSQNNHKLLTAIVQQAFAQFPGNLVVQDSESRPIGIAEYKLNKNIPSIEEGREPATVNQQLTVRTKATRADSPAFGLYKAAFNFLEFEGFTKKAGLNETAIHQMRLLTEERNIKKLKEGEQ
ncbi:MAG TPA: hypothetical protein PKD64_05955 [Pirellulaceae bacterium]|nr:hypothetical protein [Pirellulaceae bacterium]HMO91723.1 hypothetical protein [Pirellulaceae bacterium]HMP69814.1 hypothetical protein [Pirellulaceae bacterium]